MIGIVIVAHGGLAKEFRDAVEHVTGAQQALIDIAIGPECDRVAKQAEICAAADKVDQGHGVVIVTDMFGGSPSNLSLRACSPGSRRIVYGASLPLLIKLVQARGRPLDAAVDMALMAGHKYMNCFETTPNKDLVAAVGQGKH